MGPHPTPAHQELPIKAPSKVLSKLSFNLYKTVRDISNLSDPLLTQIALLFDLVDNHYEKVLSTPTWPLKDRMKEFAGLTNTIFDELYRICKKDASFQNWPKKRNTPDHIIYLLQQEIADLIKYYAGTVATWSKLCTSNATSPFTLDSHIHSFGPQYFESGMHKAHFRVIIPYKELKNQILNFANPTYLAQTGNFLVPGQWLQHVHIWNIKPQQRPDWMTFKPKQERKTHKTKQDGYYREEKPAPNAKWTNTHWSFSLLEPFIESYCWVSYVLRVTSISGFREGQHKGGPKGKFQGEFQGHKVQDLINTYIQLIDAEIEKVLDQWEWSEVEDTLKFYKIPVNFEKKINFPRPDNPVQNTGQYQYKDYMPIIMWVKGFPEDIEYRAAKPNVFGRYQAPYVDWHDEWQDRPGPWHPRFYNPDVEVARPGR